MKLITQAFTALKAKAVQVWKGEPAIVLSVGTDAVIGAAAALGVTVSHDTAGLIVELAVPLLLGGAIRSKVTPVALLALAHRSKPAAKG